MRLLVECPDCHRQYDAGRRPVGSSFRCHCGHVLAVQRPAGHEANVQRCSACGAARPDGAADCPYCGAAFTLHDRDLDTVCPHCLALVSDQAKFCHHCGTALAPEPAPGAETKMVCPACQHGQRLSSRQVAGGQLAVLECGRCAGFWVGHESFRGLIERARKESLPDGTTPETPQQLAAKFGLPAGAAAPETERGSFYRPCPACRALMARKNYGHTSGVIIDLCREDGLWFDADELARILAWVRAGGGRDPEPPAEVNQRVARAMARHGESEPVGDDRPDFFLTVLGELLSLSRWWW